MSWRETAKKSTALKAAKLVNDGYVVGLGSGSTIAYTIQELGRRIREENLRVCGVPTSYQSLLLAVDNGVPLTTFSEHLHLDLAIDGADQIDGNLDLIKGVGGALTREKIVASAANTFVIVADETKLVKTLGVNQPIPVEVLPFALPRVMFKLQQEMGMPILRQAKGKVGPVITDNGNFIIDVSFGPLSDPHDLNLRLKSIPGVIETGLFLDMADTAYVGTPNSVQILKRNPL